MSIATVTALIDDVLKPRGFRRRKSVWNRRSGSCVDAIELLTSKAGTKVTLDVGVLDDDVHRGLGEAVPDVVRVPSCTVNARIGLLIDNYDTWWSPDEPASSRELVQHMETVALDFLGRMHSREAQEVWLTDAARRLRHPLLTLKLAVLKNCLGKESEACDLLAQLGERSSSWREKIQSVADRLGCPKRHA
jgi:hypothetical protein